MALLVLPLVCFGLAGFAAVVVLGPLVLPLFSGLAVFAAGFVGPRVLLLSCVGLLVLPLVFIICMFCCWFCHEVPTE